MPKFIANWFGESMEIGALSAIALSSLINLADANSVESWDTIESYELPAISGLWVYETGEKNTCREYYNFGKNGKLTTTSLSEKTEGKYLFTRSEEFNLPLLAIHTKKDNNQPDCQGKKIDQSGDSFGVFVKLNARHNPTKMWWCDDANGEQCTMLMRRVLP